MIGNEDIQHAAASIEPGSSAALLMWEDTWATPFVQAVRNAGGVLIEGSRIPHELIEEARIVPGLGHLTQRPKGDIIMMRRRPLMRAAATTAVVAGTATAVSGRVNRRQQGRDQQAADAQAYQEMAAAPPPVKVVCPAPGAGRGWDIARHDRTTEELGRPPRARNPHR